MEKQKRLAFPVTRAPIDQGWGMTQVTLKLQDQGEVSANAIVDQALDVGDDTDDPILAQWVIRDQG